MVATKRKKAGVSKDFFKFVQEISAEKKLSQDKVINILRDSFLLSYQKEYGLHANLDVDINPEKQEVIIIHKRKVAEKSSSSDGQIALEDAQKQKTDAKLGDIIEEHYNPLETSRSLATNIRHVLLQSLRNLESELIYSEFKDKRGELINGYFLRWRDREVVYVDIGRTEGVLPRREQIPGERFRPGDRVKTIIKSVELRREKTREPGPFILLSRSSPEFVKKLFEVEIPEIYEGTVEIVNIVRQAGQRTKLLVRSTRQDIDPVGACVGVKGVRIQSIVRELGNERIDIVNLAQSPQELIANAISPAEVIEVRIDTATQEAFVVVSDNSYSVAIGNAGHNVRLACQLTAYNIIVKSQAQFNEEMSSPEAKARREAIFQNEQDDKQEADSDSTPLSALDGLTPRIARLLENNGIKNVEELVEFSEEQLVDISGLGRATAKQIRKILSETVEFEEV